MQVDQPNAMISTTDADGDFCLLDFSSGPFRPYLDDLEDPSSPRPSISAPCLALTPDKHAETNSRTPGPAKFRHQASMQPDYMHASLRPAAPARQ
ncbi:unnamed protein product [Echinostoma caproni]|uniref:Uncharacterized protein n=1 Tax=Echinostoma caproni TaxID=27848 RepID=A0A183AIF2_9TREM|nr:unnamed protein product [Echinostoma caproni]